MRRVLFGGLCVLILSTAVSAEVGGPMPDISALSAIYGTTAACDDGTEFGAILFADNPAGYSQAYFLPGEKARIPVAVVKSSGEDLLVLIDLNRDGKIDLEGAPGDKGIGEEFCDIIHDIK